MTDRYACPECGRHMKARGAAGWRIRQDHTLKGRLFLYAHKVQHPASGSGLEVRK